MPLKLSYRAAPLLLVVLSGLWAAGVYLPFVYSLAFPDHEIQHLVAALEGREPAHQGLVALVQNVISSKGRLKQVIPVAAYYGASAEYKQNRSHTSKQTEFIYIASFEGSGHTVLVIDLNETDGAALHFDVREGSSLALMRVLLLPLVVLGSSLCWLISRSRTGQIANRLGDRKNLGAASL